jgi:PPM family protein phosphatase
LEDSITYYGESITGRRSNNEDFFLCEKIDDKTFLFIVADGMGGYEHGEVASKLAVNTFFLHVREAFQQEITKARLKPILEEGFSKAQTAIKEASEKDKDHSGMGTTFVVLLIHDNMYVWGNIGDSRLYIIDSKGIEQITRDHTYIEEVLKKLKGDKFNADHYDQYSNIITRSVSGGKDKPDLFPEGKAFFSLHPPKMFLLCSDGLILKKYNKNDESEFFKTFLDDSGPEVFAKKLVMNAYENGSEDNITAVCVLCRQTDFSAKSIIGRKLVIPDKISKWINRAKNK